jgi:hypothetical protein
MFRSGIARRLLEINGYCSGKSAGEEGKEEVNDNCIEELSDLDEEEEEGQGDSIAEKEEESETEEEEEEERDKSLDEQGREERSAVVHTQAGYDTIGKGWKSMDKVTSGDDKPACIQEEVPGVSTSPCNHQK